MTIWSDQEKKCTKNNDLTLFFKFTSFYWLNKLTIKLFFINKSKIKFKKGNENQVFFKIFTSTII